MVPCYIYFIFHVFSVISAFKFLLGDSGLGDGSLLTCVIFLNCLLSVVCSFKFCALFFFFLCCLYCPLEKCLCVFFLLLPINFHLNSHLNNSFLFSNSVVSSTLFVSSLFLSS